MRKSRALFIVMIAALIMTITLAVAFGAGSPGSEDDPIVTKSYVDQTAEELKDDLQEKLDELEELLEEVKEEKAEAPAGSTSWEVVFVPKDTTVIGQTGTQMILRAGTATAVDNGANGISDLTGGADLRMGKAITKNHLLLIPGTDGRGIKTASDSWVMIQGGYTLQNPDQPQQSEMPEGI